MKIKGAKPSHVRITSTPNLATDSTEFEARYAAGASCVFTAEVLADPKTRRYVEDDLRDQVMRELYLEAWEVADELDDVIFELRSRGMEGEAFRVRFQQWRLRSLGRDRALPMPEPLPTLSVFADPGPVVSAS